RIAGDGEAADRGAGRADAGGRGDGQLDDRGAGGALRLLRADRGRLRSAGRGLTFPCDFERLVGEFAGPLRRMAGFLLDLSRVGDGAAYANEDKHPRRFRSARRAGGRQPERLQRELDRVEGLGADALVAETAGDHDPSTGFEAKYLERSLPGVDEPGVPDAC